MKYKKTNIYRTPKSRFIQIDITVAGERQHISSRTENETEALRLAKRLKAELMASAADVPVIVRKDLRFNQAAWLYWHHDGQYKRNRHQVFGMLKRCVGLVGTAVMCSQVDLQLMKDAKTAMKSSRRGRPTKRAGKYAPKTLNGYMDLILRVLNNAERELKTSFPDKPESEEVMEVAQHRSRVLSPEEEKALELTSNPDLEDMWKFDLLTGLRANELCGARWPQIGWSNRIITVEVKAVGDDPVFHEVYLDDEAMDILYRRKELGDEFIFTLETRTTDWLDGKLRNKGDRIPVSTRLLYRRMREAWTAAGVEDLIVHDFRRTAGRRVYDEKDIEAARVFLGHTDTEQTRRYLGLRPSQLKSVLARRSRRSEAHLSELDAAFSAASGGAAEADSPRARALRLVAEDRLRKIDTIGAAKRAKVQAKR